MEKLFKIEEAAEVLNFSTRSLERWIAEGRIHVVKFGQRALRIDPDELRYIRQNGLRDSHQECADSSLDAGRVLTKSKRSLSGNNRKELRLWES